ncbi:hypothetical protein [Rhizobium leguminosarum]|uniref:hypothetical protein n=1 Tax=Rhizobium leguminosarum TaxID=384 RepID=UPI001441D7E4|nr:hypothetical protein [Rhizobium leguminosarum]NKL55670.1 hypothetical protein [Rhizobium leguminosarum bv. viciae]
MDQPVQLAIRFQNDRTIREEDIDLVLLDSSISNFAISGITFSSAKPDHFVRVMLEDLAFRPAYIQIKGDRRFAISLEDSLANELNGVRNAWWWLNANNWGTVGPGTLINVLGFVLPLALIVPLFVSREMYSWVTTLSPWWLLLLFVSPTIAVVGPIIAPGIVFNFGRGSSSYGRRRAFLGLLFGGVVLGVIINKLSDKV